MFRTLTRKVLVIVIPVFMSIILAATVSITNLIAVNKQVEYLATRTVDQTRLSVAYDAQLQRMMTEIIAYMYTGNPGELEEAKEAIEQTRVVITELDNVALSVENLDGSATAQRIQQQRTELLTDIENVLEQIVQQREAQTSVTIARSLELLEELEEQREALTNIVHTHLATDVARSRQAAITSMQLGLFSITGVLAITSVLMLLSVWLLQRQIIRPIRDVSQAAMAVTQNDLTKRVAISSNDEVGTLQHSFNRMVENLDIQHNLLEQRNRELADERAALKRALDELRQNSAERTALLENTVDQLSAPILPVQEGILVMPIIGAVSEQRAQRLQDTLLHAIVARHTQMVIIDVTALTSVNTVVVQALLDTIQATLLLGARPMVVGVNPAMAAALVDLGMPLDNVHAMADLESAVAFAFHHEENRYLV